MSHGPATEWKKDNASAGKTRLGVIMVIIYTLIYSGFILINTFKPNIMRMDVGSLNVAIIYGFGLIILALAQASAYNIICNRMEEKADLEHKRSGSNVNDAGTSEISNNEDKTNIESCLQKSETEAKK